MSPGVSPDAITTVDVYDQAARGGDSWAASIRQVCPAADRGWTTPATVGGTN